MKKIGIVGSRRRDAHSDYLEVRIKFHELYEKDDWIVSGGCPKGGDNFAETFAKEYDIPILIFYRNWGRHKKTAGFIRNASIAHYSDILIACVSKDRKGGTEDTIKKFLKYREKSALYLIKEV